MYLFFISVLSHPIAGNGLDILLARDIILEFFALLKMCNCSSFYRSHFPWPSDDHCKKVKRRAFLS